LINLSKHLGYERGTVKKRYSVLAFAVVVLLAISLFLAAESFLLPKIRHGTETDFFVGVECGYNNVTLCKELIDKVNDYSNLFIVGSTDIAKNVSQLNTVCDYAFQARMHISVYFSSIQNYSALADHNTTISQSTLPLGWLRNATSKYGDYFLGAYVNDEPGGNQLDGPAQKNKSIAETDYKNISDYYIGNLSSRIQSYLSIGVKTFTSDYGLFWFDYKSGYKAVFTELGGNNGSRQLPISLCRGAATSQGKDWGVMVTTRFYDGRILESGPELYSDLVLGYSSGAKYGVVFNYALTVSDSGQEMVPYRPTEYGILRDEHFMALKNFWNYMQQNPQKRGSEKADVSLVVPRDLGFGFRNINDFVWGANGNAQSQKVWVTTDKYLSQYDSRVDLVYDDPEFSGSIRAHYSTVLNLTNG
jgi:hypothetical protein